MSRPLPEVSRLWMSVILVLMVLIAIGVAIWG